jgi:hypothetical protein
LLLNIKVYHLPNPLYILVFCTIIYGIVGWVPQKQSLKVNKFIRQDFKTNDFVYVSNLTDTNRLINLLNTKSPLEAEHIGSLGERSFSYAVYQRLCAIASEQTLLRLTYHANPKMRVYGMWALIKKNKTLAFQRMREMRDDQATIEHITGCITMPYTVSWLAGSRFDDPRIEDKVIERNGQVEFIVLIKD